MARPLTRAPVHILMALLVPLAACDSDGTGPEGSEAVTIQFATSTQASVAPGLDGPMPTTVTGSNGTLELTDVRMIVAELELEGSTDACRVEEDDDDDEDCFEIEFAPRLVDLPLDGGPLTVTTAEVPAGIYSEFEFEVEDLEDDEDDTEFAAEIDALQAAILNAFPNWPDEATVRIEGTFTETGGEPQPFTVYLEAEIEVELEMDPLLVIGDDGAEAHTIEVVVFPDLWFARNDGSVLDLSQFDFETTGQVLELEVEIEEGFEVEIDDD